MLCHSQGITMGTRLTLNTVFLPKDFFLSNPVALGDLSNCYSPAGSSIFCLQKLLRRPILHISLQGMLLWAPGVLLGKG